MYQWKEWRTFMLRLMIVDDEEIIRKSLAKIVDWESIGYELIAVAQNGIEAYDIICDEYPDVVITDLKMPILNGLDLIKRAIDLDKDIRFIILSGYGEFEYAKEAMKFGVKHYLLKPTEKQQVLDALLEIKQNFEDTKQSLAAQQKTILESMHFTIEKSFLLEALHGQDDLHSIIAKYQKLLDLPEGSLQLCICSYLEEQYLHSFAKDLDKLCKSLGIQTFFPLIYVHPIAVLLLKIDGLSTQTSFIHSIEHLKYPGQSVSLGMQVQVYDHFEALLEVLLLKLQRYSRILLYDAKNESQEIRNNHTAPWDIDGLRTQLQNAPSLEKVSAILSDTFQTILQVDTGIAFAINLYLHLKPNKDPLSYDQFTKFIEHLHHSVSVSDVLETTQKHLLPLLNQGEREETNIKHSIENMKNYVLHHLDANHLSLKWLAENYLFISVGYLSKQFIKEEGERFSDYLNRQRMEKAKQLLLTYSASNIKDVAAEVGFENNPRYFSQVFKRYTGLTPSEFVEQAMKR